MFCVSFAQRLPRLVERLELRIERLLSRIDLHEFPANGVGIVTSEYHLYRAKRMVRALGAEPVGIAAETTLPTMRVNYFIREAFAAAYMQLAGTLY